MKPILITLVCLMCFIDHTHGQDFALASFPSSKPMYASNFSMQKKHANPPGALSIAGGCMMAGGCIIFAVGVIHKYKDENANNGVLYGNAQPASNTGQTLEVLGGVVAGAGLIMTIVGSIHDHKKAKSKKVSIIAPKRNEIGLAYHF